MSAPAEWITVQPDPSDAAPIRVPSGFVVAAPDHTTRVAINTLLATHGHTLPVEHRAALRGWLGRIA
jgi:hypothetical protein